MSRVSSLFFIAFCLLITPAEAQKSGAKSTESKVPELTSSLLTGLSFRSIGPALPSGRIIDIAVQKDNPALRFIAVACGGVWKTTNAGVTWDPVFDGERSFSIGCVAIDPTNPWIVWVGTGENNSQRSVSYGDGVYKSTDGGKSWKSMGLPRSEHIGKILIHPTNSDIVYVAAQGPLWGPGGDRGLYKTTDGGKTWKAVLSISENTGVTDVVMDPRDDRVLYAASYQRRRHVWTLINGGPESMLLKSTDAGATWDTLKAGLPSVEMGRIGLAISPVQPDRIFAVIEAAEGKGGIFRSTNRGATWEKRNAYVPGSPQYYNELICDPVDADVLYSLDTYTQLSEDGGATWKSLGNRARHVDDHALWIDPANTRHLLIGGDGGLYESWDRGATWRFFENLPITQFYRVTVDNSLPFYSVYGGTQDNNSLGGPSRTTKSDGIMNEDWFFTNGGDGFTSQVDPNNPNIVYAQSQYGGLVRYDRKSGESISIQPQPGDGEPPLRWNWDSPLIISPHSPTRLYFAANILFRSDDRGDTWTPVSGDLTRTIDRNLLPVMGRVWGPDAVAKNASTSLYGNIVALAESPLAEGLLYVGTDDGLVQVSEDGGKSWRTIERFPGIPDRTYVSCLHASAHEARTVFATFDNHKNADFSPYVLKSTDAGRSWVPLATGLPKEGSVYSIVQDPVQPRLLFAGTEFGFHLSTNGGEKWITMRNGLPPAAIRDIVVQKRESDVVVATFGRGFYVLDDITPLRACDATLLESRAHVFPIRPALMYHPENQRSRGAQGETFFLSPNPPFGAVFTYYLKEGFTSKKEERKKREQEAKKKNETIPYPTIEDLRAEEEEKAPVLTFTIRDEAGEVVRILTAPVSKGVQRLTWDLRLPDTRPVRSGSSVSSSSILAMPGTYSVSLAMTSRTETVPLAGPVSFTCVPLAHSTLPAQDRSALLAFQKQTAELHRRVLGAERRLRDIKTELSERIVVLTHWPTTDSLLLRRARALDDSLAWYDRLIGGDDLAAARNENQIPSMSNRIQEIVWGQWSSSSAPTTTMRINLEIAQRRFAPIEGALRDIQERLLPALRSDMEARRMPY